jgi:hypothetical protein
MMANLLPWRTFGLPHLPDGGQPARDSPGGAVSREPPGCDLARMTTNRTAAVRELDHRVSDGIDVRLLWRPHDDRALVAVSDFKTGEAFTIEVGRDQRALDVFHHPFAYAPTRRSGGNESTGELELVTGP